MGKEKLNLWSHIWNYWWAFVVLPLTILLSFFVFSITDAPLPAKLITLFLNIVSVTGTVFQVLIRPDDRKSWLLNTLGRENFITRKLISGSATWIVNQNRESLNETKAAITSEITSVIRQEAQTDEFHDHLAEILKDAIRQRLNDTIYRLDSLALSLDVAEVPNATITSRLFEYKSFENEPSQSSNQQHIISFEEGFESHHRKILLLGNAGAGKSTTLALFAEKQIQNRLNNPHAKLPIYVPITNWRGNKPLAKWILQEANLPPKAIEQIDKGKAILLLDGLDEIPVSALVKDSDHDFQTEFLSSFKDELHGNDVVITSREQDYERLCARSKTKIYVDGALVIQPLTDEQIESYLQSLPNLWSVLKSDERLLEMTRTPLLLRIFTIAYKDLVNEARQLALIRGGDGELRDKVFEMYVRNRHSHEQQKSRINIPNLARIYDVLGEIAPHNPIFIKRHLQDLLGDNSERFIDQMCDMNILVKSEKGNVSFIHLLLQDHFAWQPLIAMLQRTDKLSKSRAAYSLGEMGDTRAVPFLIDGLREQYGVQKEMAKALGIIGDSEAVPSLIELLKGMKADVQEAAIQALGLIRDSRSIRPVINMLGEKENLRRYASKALEQFGEMAIEELIEALDDDRINVRTEAAWILARIKAEQAVQPLIAALRHAQERIEVPFPAFAGGYLDPSHTLLRVDVQFLEFIHVASDVAAYVGALAYLGLPSVERLVDLFLSSSSNLKEAAMWAIARIGDKNLFEFFIDALSESSDKIRAHAVYGIAKIDGLSEEKDFRAVPYLVNILREQPILPILFECTIWAVAVIGEPVCVKAIIDYLPTLTSAHNRVKFHAIGGLGLSRLTEAVPVIITFLKDPDYYVSECAAEALGRIKDTQAVEPLIEVLIDKEGKVSDSVVKALGEIGDKRAIKPLMEHFGELDFIAPTLYQLGDKSIITDLQEIAINDERQWVRQSASELIAKLEAL